MRQFDNLLFVSHQVDGESFGMRQALSLSRNNSAPLTVLGLVSELPSRFTDVQYKYLDSVMGELESVVEQTKSALGIEKADHQVTYDSILDKVPSVSIIKKVLQHEYDLVIKEAEPSNAESGFKAIDMDLLRKCPSPVWLCRPISKPRCDINIAVAIDPDCEEAAATTLSKHMIDLARELADDCGGELNIVSCWDLEFESTLRKSPFYGLSDEEIDSAVEDERLRHLNMLESLISDANNNG